MTMSIFYALSEDVRFYHRLRFPGQQPTYLSCAQTLLSASGIFVLTVQRLYNKYSRISDTGPVERLLKPLMYIMVGFGSYLSRVFFKIEFLIKSEIEAGVYLSHRGYILLGARAIGSGTIIHDHITLGSDFEGKFVPCVGRNVWIGPYSIIYGNIEIGDGVTVLPHTVVSKSLPPRVVVGGNPARIIMRDFDNYKFRCALSLDVSRMLDENISGLRIENV